MEFVNPIVGESPAEEARQSRAVDRFLNELETQPGHRRARRQSGPLRGGAAGHHGLMHPGTPESPGPQQSAPPYAVVVEEMRRRNGQWRISLIQPVGGGLAEARAAGRNIAFNHQPESAGRKRRRDVYQLGEDSWLIIYNAPWLTGATAHFRVSVARYVGSVP